MRRWADYCYLRENGKPYAQLEVCRQPGAGYRCFGPFRSRQSAADARDTLAAHLGLALCPDEPTPSLRRPLGTSPRAGPVCKRYYQGTCSGPCAERVGQADYDRRIKARAALLTGKTDSTVRRLEARLETAAAEGTRDDDYHARLRQATTLRAVFDQSAIRREAERLIHALLLLPGPTGLRKTALPATKRIRFDVLGPTVADAGRILRHARAVTGRTGLGNNGRLPKTAMDSLCIVARQLRQAGNEYGFISRRDLAGVDESTLLAKAFGVD